MQLIHLSNSIKGALCAASAMLALGVSVPAYAGTIFLSGDTNIVNPLVGSSGQPVDPGNVQFFTNILQNGTNVVVQSNDNSDPFVANAEFEFNSFYNSLAGVTSTIVSSPITESVLSDADLFISFMPDESFAAAEIESLSDFLNDGGTIFFLGENFGFVDENARINTALAGLGSNLRIIDDSFDGGFNTATGSQIASNPFTVGVNTFTYAAPSEVSTVSGGTSLFFGTTGQTFLAVENTTPVPEPSNVGSTVIVAGVGGWLIKRKLKASQKVKA
ncbi:PEP-CTERM sorting domain-containing protein [Nostoc sp. UHCC 0702]|nr:PEP-CTERM sorting domain-containing protein [Nostoc sp. UHCC 0702]